MFFSDKLCRAVSLLYRTLCGEYEVPQSHLADCHTCSTAGTDCALTTSGGPGVAGADFILYVTSRRTERCEGGSEAYSGHCQQEQSRDRPVAGHTNICPTNKVRK